MKIIVTNLFATSLSLFIAKDARFASAFAFWFFFIVFNYTWSPRSVPCFTLGPENEKMNRERSSSRSVRDEESDKSSEQKRGAEEVNLELELKSRQMMMMILSALMNFSSRLFLKTKIFRALATWWPTIALISLDISHVCARSDHS